MSKLMMTPEEGEDFKRTLPAVGIDTGVLYSIVDLGTQSSKRYGAKRKIELSWSLPNQKHVFNEEDGLKPLIVSQIYTLSFNVKSNLYKAVAAMLGKSPIAAFDLFSLIGINAELSIEHEVKENDTFAIVKHVMNSKKEKIEGEMQEVTLSLEPGDFESDVFESLPIWKQDLIARSPELKTVYSLSSS